MQTPTGDGIAYPDPNYIDFTRTTVPRRPTSYSVWHWHAAFAKMSPPLLPGRWVTPCRDKNSSVRAHFHYGCALRCVASDSQR